ncbi:hypothetical protein [Rhizobium leguminosarum]|uniref:hypothetical protein n=1 Tax=Rhizobium leguminosarum TaxID=384 RepID=UPI001C96164B|nr:hypothetical protein [Rhizobium leguminosarum]MBY5329557.1 hypothetical protein [Rhizobium leguminosarum]
MSERSTRYSSTENQKSRHPDRDDLEGRRRKLVGNALRVLRIIAGADLDQAKQLNGVGFSKGDTTLGHRLSALTVEQAMSDGSSARKIIMLALRYIRQAFQIQTHGLF